MDDSGFFARLNPVIKLLFHLGAMLLLTMVNDPRTSFLFLLIPAGLSFLLLRVKLKTLFFLMIPFLAIFILSVWSLFAFGSGETVWWSWGWFHFTKEGLLNGLTIGFRTLSYLFYGIIFMFTTNITDLVYSLMQQLRLKPKWAYGLLAGIRFFPEFWNEFEQIRAAHRVRGIHRSHSLKGKVKALMRYAIPLLAQGIRKADRVAVAIEAKGFNGDEKRTFHRQTRVSQADAIYGVLLFVLHVTALVAATYFWGVDWGLVL